MYVKTAQNYRLRSGRTDLGTTGNRKEAEVYIDGSSIGLYGFMLADTQETVVIQENAPITNNKSEWLALYSFILHAPEKWQGIVFSDSQLVVNQFNGRYRIEDPELKRLSCLCKLIAQEKGLKINLRWIPRKVNLFGKKLEREVKRRRRKWKQAMKIQESFS